MALLRAYFDESGTHGKAKVTGVAGYIGPVNSWKALESEWKIQLPRFSRDTGRNIPAFHAYDCENGEDYWAGINRSIREAYYQKLARIVSTYKDFKGIAVCVENNAWDLIATAPFKERYTSPYGLCAEHCFQQVSSYEQILKDRTMVWSYYLPSIPDILDE